MIEALCLSVVFVGLYLAAAWWISGVVVEAILPRRATAEVVLRLLRLWSDRP